MVVKVEMFGQLRNYFEHELEITLPAGATIRKLVEHLSTKNPDATDLLAHCRLAIHDIFVAPNQILQPEELIYVMPN